MRPGTSEKRGSRRHAPRAFSLAELLVVIGVLALLLAIMTPPLKLAHRQAVQTKCAAHLQQVGVALERTRMDYDDYYPLWDDAKPARYSWLDVLMQVGNLPNPNAGYCPADNRPDWINVQRGKFYGVLYPGAKGLHGVDYSYGISVPLSAAGWTWQASYADPGDPGPRHLEGVDNFTSSRVLAGDAGWTQIYNLSGEVLRTGIWNYPTQFDNTVAWWRHPSLEANLLLQDGHVKGVKYQLGAPHPVNTNSYFVWYPGEPLDVGPDDRYNGNYYPNDPPVDPGNPADIGSYSLLSPGYYSKYRLWTGPMHPKTP